MPVWSRFADLSNSIRLVSDPTGTPLAYYRDNTDIDNLRGFLRHRNGQSGSWVKFLEAAIKTQGVGLSTGSSDLRIMSIRPYLGNDQAIFIKNAIANDAVATSVAGYDYSPNVHLNDQEGLAGQGVTTLVYKIFAQHIVLVEYQISGGFFGFGSTETVVKIYDPSYGRSFNSLSQWEEASVLGTVTQGTVTGMQGNKALVRKRIPGETRTQLVDPS